jgi:hypothetical protein
MIWVGSERMGMFAVETLFHLKQVFRADTSSELV